MKRREPCTVTRNERLALCPITTRISVGSPTKQAAGFTFARSSRAIMPRTPMQPTARSWRGIVAFAHLSSNECATHGSGRERAMKRTSLPLQRREFITLLGSA
jgi:hypothetical protein